MKKRTFQEYIHSNSNSDSDTNSTSVLNTGDLVHVVSVVSVVPTKKSAL
jgi:hypothetical protein